MKKLLMVLVLVASAVAASAQGLRPRRTLGSRLARPRPQATEGIVGKEAIKVIPTAREGGATWKYKESDKPLTNWADLSFDDKDWQEGVSGFGNSYGLRRTAWSGGANDLYLRKTFSISGTTGQIERVTLTYAIDDDIEVLLNGTELFSRKVGWWAKYASVDVTKDFKRLVLEPGKENVIAVKAHDRKPPCYADVGLEIVLSDTNQGKKNVSAQPAESQSVAHVTDVALIPFGATEWKYKMQGEVEENWKSPDFNDASWANGETPFGNGTWTTTCICLRKKFDCPYEDADIKYLQIREGIDDVLDIWLNGSHIFHWTYHGNSDLTTVVPRKLWEGLLRRKDNVLTVLARDWGGGRFVNVGLTAMVRQSVGKELVCPTEYVPADMKLIFPATKLADIQVCSAVLTGDAVNWGRPTAVLASNVKSVGDVRKTLQFQRLENNDLKCACVELEQKGRDIWGRVLYCRRVNHCDVSCADFDTLLGPTHRVIDNDSEVANGSRGDGFALKEFTVYFASGVDCNGACTGRSTGLRRPGGLLGGSLRARRLQRQQEAQAAAAKQQAEEAAKDAERQAQVAAEKAQREAERAEQRRQLAAINEELKKVREQKAAAAKSECAASCITNKPTSGKGVVAEKLGQCDFLLNKDFKKNAKFYLCLFSASWCGPCRREMPRIAKTYAETLKDDPDIELIHFSRDQDEEKAMAWAKEHDVKFPVVKPNGGNPLDLHSRGIPHLFIVKADGTLVEEGHPMRIFNEEKFRELKSGGPVATAKTSEGNAKASASRQCAGKMPSQFMPTKGLLASFDYDGGKETNAGYGEVRRENDHVAFVEGAADYDGIYRYGSSEDYVIPDFNFDHFTVACSFRPTHTNDLGQYFAYFFRIGMASYSILEARLNRGLVFVRGKKLKELTLPYVVGEWNWLIVSVDVVNREAWLSVNGCEPVKRQLPEDFFWFIPADSVAGDKFRRLTFGNWQGGQRYLGQVDDLMVYDRALGREEFADVCRQTVKAKGPAAASFEKPAPAKIPELRDDSWLFMPHDEQSVYWNGTIRTRDVTLRVRREVDGLCVEPPGGIVDSVLDFTLPVVDALGQPLAIVGVGSECDPYCIRARKDSMSEVRLPDTLKTIRKNAFAGCLKLEAVVIPENVREIGTFAFTDCGHLTKLEIRSKSVAVAKNAFSGSTPVGTDMPQRDWTTGPLTKEIKGDPKFEYAKEGRMTEPLFSFSYGDILFGRKYGDVGGWGSTRMEGHEDWGEFDLSFIKLGTDQLAGVTLKWGKKEEVKGTVDAAKAMAKELVALIEEKVGGRIDAPLYLPESEWPEYGSKGNYYADYSKLKPIGSSQSEVNGYTVKVGVYGGTKDVNVAVVITIIDNYMFKAWGMSSKI